MKTKRTMACAFLLFFSFLYAPAQDSIPNKDFEYWSNNTTPIHWNTVNDLLPPGIHSVSRSSAAHSGSYAMQLKTVDIGGGQAILGVASLGIVDYGFTYGGVPFVDKPSVLNGYFLHPSYGDEVMVIVQFFKEGEEIGNGFWSTTDSISEYALFTAPITYFNTSMPDTMNITIISDQNVLGSSLTVDGLHFPVLPGIQQNVVVSDVGLYPNPTSGKLMIDTSSETGNIKIFDKTGRLLREFEHESSSPVIDIRDLPPDLYMLIYDGGGQKITKKFIKM